mgnify:CR=1 FL=1
MIQNTDIVYVLSGGSTNADPKASLGGDPSAVPILNGLNNLLANVSATDAKAGYVDYACFYIFNDSLEDTLWNSGVYLTNQSGDGSVIELGFTRADEIQKLIVSGQVTGGSLTLSYDGDNFSFGHDSNLGTWTANFQSALRTIDALADVVVNADQTTSTENVVTTAFTILYTGNASGNRFQPILTLVSNDLDPAPVISVSRSVGGSPINSIATLIDKATTVPSNVTFYSPTESEPFSIGDLRPTDGFPVWMKRTTPANSLALADDTLRVVCNGTAFPA